MPNSKLKACLLINMISPARLRLYSALADHFDLLILHGGIEANRASWRDAEKALPHARVKRAWGWQVSLNQEDSGTVIDRRFVHVTPGCVASLLQFHPDVIVTNEMGFRTVVALAYGALFRRPVWVWWGGTPHTERNIGPARKIARRIISHWARHWISYGRSSTDYLVSLGVAEKNILELQNAVDEDRFVKDAEKEFQIQPRPVLLHVGQLIARKGIALMLQAAASLQREGSDFSLLLVGGGADERALKEMAQTLGLKNVHFCPELPPEKMPGVYRSADLLVFPTIEDVWGLVVNEAILSELPVLCSRYAGCAQELLPAENVFDPRNPEEFKEKLRAAIAGQISKPDPSRLRTTPQLAGCLIQALESSLRGFSPVLEEKTKKPARIQTEGPANENMPSTQQL
jgi:glycosyltransferase involved in cell wall biosynthesis